MAAKDTSGIIPYTTIDNNSKETVLSFTCYVLSERQEDPVSFGGIAEHPAASLVSYLKLKT